MPSIEPRITTGNVISTASTLLVALGMIITLAVWSGRQGQRIDNAEKQVLTNQTSLAGHESRIRSIEQSSARQDERLLLILDSVRKIEAKLERDRPN